MYVGAYKRKPASPTGMCQGRLRSGRPCRRKIRWEPDLCYDCRMEDFRRRGKKFEVEEE